MGGFVGFYRCDCQCFSAVGVMIKMFEKEVTRYYCLRCKRVSKHLRMNKCPYCRGDCEEVKLERSIWGRIGKILSIAVGLFVWSGCGIVFDALIRHTPIDVICKMLLFMAIPGFLFALFLYMIFSVKDENIIATKISKMKGVPPPLDIITFPPRRLVKKGEKTCGNCLRPVPADTKKCPFCGYEYL